MGGAHHPTHSLNLLPNSFHLLGPFKKAIKSCMLMLDDEKRDAVVEWFRQRPKEFFADWIN